MFNEEPLGGSSWYNGVTVEYTHPFHHGAYFLASYTVSKFMDNTMGGQDWISGSTSGIRSIYNLAAEKALNTGFPGRDIQFALKLLF